MLMIDLNKTTSPEIVQRVESLKSQMKTIEVEVEVHLRKWLTFYDRKRAFRKMCSKKVDHAAIAVDCQKQLPVPKISNNLV